jgi:hypothetical protein
MKLTFLLILAASLPAAAQDQKATPEPTLNLRCLLDI